MYRPLGLFGRTDLNFPLFQNQQPAPEPTPAPVVPPIVPQQPVYQEQPNVTTPLGLQLAELAGMYSPNYVQPELAYWQGPVQDNAVDPMYNAQYWAPLQGTFSPQGFNHGQGMFGGYPFGGYSGFGAGSGGRGYDSGQFGDNFTGSFTDWAKTSLRGLTGVVNPFAGAYYAGRGLYDDYRGNGRAGGEGGYGTGGSFSGREDSWDDDQGFGVG